MSDRSDIRQTDSRLDAGRGREASAEELRRHLSSAPAEYLEGALQNRRLGPEGLRLLLNNRRATAALLGRIGRDPRWIRHHEVRKTLVRHPRTPLPLSRNLLPHLRWKDLAETAVDPHANPVIKRRAEKLLETRLEQLALGERVALARRASRELIACLLDDEHEPVLRALLGNTRFTESDAVRVASAPTASPPFLGHLARHPEWGRRRAVRWVLLRNSRTPVPAALSLLQQQSSADLRRLAGDDKVPRIVRVGASRILQRESRPVAQPRREGLDGAFSRRPF